MGLSDTVLILDGKGLPCAGGHFSREFQTKDLDEPSMCTYLLHGGVLYRASPRRDETESETESDEDSGRWRVEGGDAIFERRSKLFLVPPPRTVHIYGRCKECEPVLVRTDGKTFFGDLVNEHSVAVDYTLTLRANEPVQPERTSGTRNDLLEDLRKRGLWVLGDDEPLAVAHREVKQAQERLGRLSRFR